MLSTLQGFPFVESVPSSLSPSSSPSSSSSPFSSSSSSPVASPSSLAPTPRISYFRSLLFSEGKVCMWILLIYLLFFILFWGFWSSPLTFRVHASLSCSCVTGSVLSPARLCDLVPNLSLRWVSTTRPGWLAQVLDMEVWFFI